jgi:cystathionine beta-synthase
MNGDVDAIVLGAGSCGTASGFSKYLKNSSYDTELILADPVGSILADYVNKGELTTKSSIWLVEGIGEDFIPDITDFDRVTKAYSITDGESFDTARDLLHKEGILVGSSTGTLVSAAIKYCQEQSEAKRVVSLACDTGNKYLSKLFNDFWMEDQGFIARESYGDLRDLVGRPHGERATITVGPGDVVTTAHNRLRNAGFSQLPVMHEGELVGVVTEDTIIRFAFGKPELMNGPVQDAMQTEFIRLQKDASLNNLVAMLQVQPYAAVMDGDEFLGLITRSDVLNHLRRQL